MAAGDSIEKYVWLFASLNTDKSASRWPDRTRNRDPQKPLLLLSILDLFELGEIDSNLIEITEDLLELFDNYWVRALPFMKPSTLAMPLPPIRFHDLRHTCVTLLLSKDVNAKVVSEMLGHSSISVTLDIYSRLLPDMQEKAAKALKEALK